MTNAKILLIIIASLLIGATVTYSFNSSPEEQIEKQNKQNTKDCLSKINYWSWSSEIQTAITACWKMELKKIVGWKSLNATGSKVPEPPKGYIAKHTLVLTWSNSYVKYSSRVWASWKNNNPSWITWGVSDTLKWLWDNAWISYKKGSPRPANEKGNYVYFETVEDGLKAKIIAIRERWKNATVEHYLGWWGTDDIKLSFDKTKIIKDLSDSEVTELFIQQVKKESPWYISQLVSDNILIIQ